jgi:hypothetical protein
VIVSVVGTQTRAEARVIRVEAFVMKEEAEGIYRRISASA